MSRYTERMQERMKAARQALEMKRAPIARALSTQDGQELLKLLREQFDADDLLGGDPLETAFNLGGREVYRSLARLVQTGGK